MWQYLIKSTTYFQTLLNYGRDIQLSKSHLLEGFLTPNFPAMVLKSGLETPPTILMWQLGLL